MEEETDTAYAALITALQALDDLGEDLRLYQAWGTNPQRISGRTHLLGCEDGEWQARKIPREDTEEGKTAELYRASLIKLQEEEDRREALKAAIEASDSASPWLRCTPHTIRAVPEWRLTLLIAKRQHKFILSASRGKFHLAYKAGEEITRQEFDTPEDAIEAFNVYRDSITPKEDQT